MNDEDRKTWTYQDALAAVQAGVAVKQRLDPMDGTSKHLRVGLNSAMSAICAIERLLIAKGVCTEGELLEAVRVGMLDEVALMERTLTELFGRAATLHPGHVDVYRETDEERAHVAGVMASSAGMMLAPVDDGGKEGKAN